ncbi:peptidoglycan meso-diaminopimelic acid protein amidase [Rouxiella badensis]|jgi:murein L,D-transpeptidase YafK|uniref:peptidoglycan meso-diaminopimelic acid protein amidase n=1 Tax=Rouxiella badensis TaxID=1646377 RepID=UPI003C5B894D
MVRIALLLAMLFSLPFFAVSTAVASEQVPVESGVKQQLLGSPVYIQIFKQERTLELYAKVEDKFQLVGAYRICDFSGGLGNKRREGDFKSPEGFYNIDIHHLKPDSRFYRAINIGFPNDYDRAQGYSGKYLMIHGNCLSIGCYAMTDAYMNVIYNYVQAAFDNGQRNVEISIYPFKMTDSNMQLHRGSYYINFWRQLQPGYAYFQKYHQPPSVSVINGNYVVNQSQALMPQPSQLAFATVK